MKKELQIISKSQAIKLKKLGYNWDYRFFQNKSYSPITPVQLVLKWLREEKNIHVKIYPDWNAEADLREANGQWGFDIVNLKDDIDRKNDKKWHRSFEKAESAGLDFALNLLK